MILLAATGQASPRLILYPVTYSPPFAMKNTLKLLVIMSSILCVGEAADDGFVSIFNGRDLSGWKSNEETPDSFGVANGQLIAHNGRAHLFYTGPDGRANFRDFELKAKVKTAPQANGGIYFHTTYQETGWPTEGFECQVNSTQKDPKKTGSLYGVVNVLVLAEGQKAPPGSLKNIVLEEAPSRDGEWFDYHIKVVGKRIVIKVNGVTTVDWTQPQDFDPAKELKNMPGRKLGSGTFAIQAHDPKSVTFYKDLQLKVLD